jgi:hypothetical protein
MLLVDDAATVGDFVGAIFTLAGAPLVLSMWSHYGD